MALKNQIIDTFLTIVNFICKIIPQPKPSQQLLQNIKLIAHRGIHNKTALENTIKAFDLALQANIWGIEFDIRWTKDHVPVVCHDENCQRVFNQDIQLSMITATELGKQIPQIPTLAEVITHYGKKICLFIEIKQDNHINLKEQSEILKKLLAPLTIAKDYWLISFYPDRLDAIDLPANGKYLITEQKTQHLSQLAISRNYAGLLGHYFFMKKDMIEKHHQHGQTIGLGFIDSKNSLYREIHRHVDLIFSNNIAELKAIISNPDK